MIFDFPAVHPRHPHVGNVVRDLHSPHPTDMTVTEVDSVGSGVVCDWKVGEFAQKVWFPFSSLRVVSRAVL